MKQFYRKIVQNRMIFLYNKQIWIAIVKKKQKFVERGEIFLKTKKLYIIKTYKAYRFDRPRSKDLILIAFV